MAENENAGEKPKIIVDDDWKAQARAEKERLAREVEQKQAAQQPAAAPAGGEAPPQGAAGQAGQQTRQLPPASFSAHVSLLVNQAFAAMGGMEDPRTKKRYVDLDLAKFHVDTLAMLEEKTQGNLSEDEQRLLNHGLYECRMQYVHIAQNVAEMTAPGAEFER